MLFLFFFTSQELMRYDYLHVLFKILGTFNMCNFSKPKQCGEPRLNYDTYVGISIILINQIQKYTKRNAVLAD